MCPGIWPSSVIAQPCRFTQGGLSLSLGPEKLLDGVFSYSGAAGNSETLPQTGHSSMMMAMIKILIIY